MSESKEVIQNEAVEAALMKLPLQSAPFVGRSEMRAALEAAAPLMIKSAYDLGLQHGANQPTNPYGASK